MPTAETANAVELLKGFTDVLYLTNQRRVPPEVRRLLKRRGLSLLALPIDQFFQILHRLDLIGTVIVDAEYLSVSQQRSLARIIESLETQNIGAILLNNRVRIPVKSFSLAGPGVKSFSLVTAMDSVSVNELWVRISVNLAYRKRGSEIAVKPAEPPKEMQNAFSNKLAEQLRKGEELVSNLTEQLRMAGLVQRDFLPGQLPNTERLHWATTFLPVEWVSGDIYDVARLDERHIGFYVADVVGHGIPAALLTIFLKQALVMRETVGNEYRIFSPAEVMRNLNVRMMNQKLSGYQFATCCYCLLNVETLEMTFARAGHPHPIIIKAGQEPQQLEVQGPLLGIFEDAEYPEQTIQFESGDELLIYSDGAEPFIPFIGTYDELTGFDFKQESHEIKDLPITEMMTRLNSIVRSKKIKPSEVDDVTVVGLEVL